MRTTEEKFRETVRVIPDFPKKGILFRDITPVLADPQLCSDILNELVSHWSNVKIDAIAGIESRGFLFGMSLAGKLGVPFIPLRKVGKLPGDTYQSEYQLEYGSAILEMQKDAINSGQQILIHDDLLATAGTAKAAAHLVEQARAEVVGFSFLIELEYFNGRELLTNMGVKVDCLTSF